MSSIEEQIYEANEQTVQENLKLTSAQSEQVDQIVNSKLSEIKQDTERQRMVVDYLSAKMDPTKQNFDELCKLGAEVVDKNHALQMGLTHADNKPNFLYEIGRREYALKQLTGQGNQPHQPQPQQTPTPSYHGQATPPPPQNDILPNPQFASSPYQGEMSLRNTQWGNMNESQFLGQLETMGLPL